ncbi:MAG: c-type cytochrome domain-containing protein, partial [Planctomycetota bacterium]
MPSSFATTGQFLVALFFSTAALSGLPAGEPEEATQIQYQRDVYPILQKYCVGCHTADDAQGELVMESFAAFSQGGQHGPAFTAGRPESSRFLLMSNGKMEPAMPPDDEEGPNETEMELLTRWVADGARGPNGIVDPLSRPMVPEIARGDRARLPITAIATTKRHRALGRFAGVEISQIGAMSNQSVFIRDLPGKVNDLTFSSDGRFLLV